MSDYLYKVVTTIMIFAFTMLFGLLYAFPIKWMWNYSAVYVFNLPKIDWGHAWCLWMLSSVFIKSSLIDIKR